MDMNSEKLHDFLTTLRKEDTCLERSCYAGQCVVGWMKVGRSGTLNVLVYFTVERATEIINVTRIQLHDTNTGRKADLPVKRIRNSFHNVIKELAFPSVEDKLAHFVELL